MTVEEKERAIKKSLGTEQNTSSIISTLWGVDNMGKSMPNAVGLPTRVYVHNGREWTNGKEGVFTEADIEDIVNMYKAIALQIKTLLGQKTRDRKSYIYREAVLPNRLG
jgi:hypothetical protein